MFKAILFADSRKSLTYFSDYCVKKSMYFKLFSIVLVLLINSGCVVSKKKYLVKKMELAEMEKKYENQEEKTKFVQQKYDGSIRTIKEKDRKINNLHILREEAQETIKAISQNLDNVKGELFVTGQNLLDQIKEKELFAKNSYEYKSQLRILADEYNTVTGEKKKLRSHVKNLKYQVINLVGRVNSQKRRIASSQKAFPEKNTYSGWCYLGKFEHNKQRWKSKTIKGYDGIIPKNGEKVILKTGVHLRDDRPLFPNIKKGRLVQPNVVPVGAELTIENIDSKIGFNNIWAEVRFPSDNIAELTEKARKNDSALLAAVKSGYLPDVLTILKKNPDIDVRYKDGMTPLIFTAKNGYTDIFRVLLDKGADVNAKANDGWTALMSASWKGHTTIVKAMLNSGADVNKISNNGWTALLVASKYGYTDIVKALQTKGADVTAKNRKGISALEMAKMKNHTYIVQLLEQ